MRGQGLAFPARRAGSEFVLVLERELELGAVGDRPALVQVNVLLDDFGHPQVADCLGGCPDRFRCGIFPRRAACPDDLDDLVHAHVMLLLYGCATRTRAGRPAATRNPATGSSPAGRPGRIVAGEEAPWQSRSKRWPWANRKTSMSSSARRISSRPWKTCMKRSPGRARRSALASPSARRRERA